MRVEQRIGRIDRLGQKHTKIRIVNLHYEGTVETDVYMALRRRIHLFESVVGRLQPILAKMSSVITGHVLGNRTHDPEARAALTGELEQQAEQAKREGLTSTPCSTMTYKSRRARRQNSHWPTSTWFYNATIHCRPAWW